MKLGEPLTDHNNKNYYDRDDELSSELTANDCLSQFRQAFVELFEQISNLTKNMMRQEFLQ